MQKQQHVYQSYCAPKFTLQSKTTSVGEGVSYSVYHGPAVGFPSPLARGPGLYLASYFIYLAPLQWGDEEQRRGGGWRWEAEMRGWGGGGGEEYKRIKRREEGVGERQREEEDVWKAGSSGRSTCHWRGSCFLSPSPPLFLSIHLFLSGNRTDTQKGERAGA